MSTPRFSIVIPTRQRHQTLGSAIRSVLFQDFPDFELIVMDNCGSEDTRKVVDQYPSPKLKYDRSDRVLPMNENWERGLSHCTGDYVFFLGDDDALMPDGLAIADQILRRASLDLLSWNKYTYWWENAIEEKLRGRLFVHFGWEFRMLDLPRVLASYYKWEAGLDILPSVYNSLVRRSLIEAVKAKHGRYFFASSPDAFSGIANAYHAQSAGRFERGLSLCGNSGSSVGCSHFFRSKGSERRKLYYQDEGASAGELVHPSLIPTVNLEVNLADAQIRAKEAFFGADERYQVSIPTLLRAMAGGINRDPGSYDDTMRDMGELAAKYGIDLAAIPIPQRQSAEASPMQGLITNGNGQPASLAVHCPEAGVHDSAQAARLAHAVLPTICIQ